MPFLFPVQSWLLINSLVSMDFGATAGNLSSFNGASRRRRRQEVSEAMIRKKREAAAPGADMGAPPLPSDGKNDRAGAYDHASTETDLSTSRTDSYRSRTGSWSREPGVLSTGAANADAQSQVWCHGRRHSHRHRRFLLPDACGQKPRVSPGIYFVCRPCRPLQAHAIVIRN